MTTIIDALAKLRFREAFRTSTSPQDDESRPKYVTARKRHRSGRKGRTSVYRVVDDKVDKHGRRVRTYANVEGDGLDDDERESFTSSEKRKIIKSGQSVRHKKKQTPQQVNPPKKDEPQAKSPPIRSMKKIEVSRGRRFECGNTRQAAAKARTQATARRSRSDEEQGTSRPNHSQQQQHEGSDSGISSNAGVNYNTGGRATKKTIEETKFYCSGALPDSSGPTCRSEQISAGVSRIVKPKKAAKEYNTIKLVEAPEAISKKPPNPSEILSPSFRQPLLSTQESTRLVFGTESKRPSRSSPRLDHIRESMDEAGHARCKIKERGWPLVKEQQRRERLRDLISNVYSVSSQEGIKESEEEHSQSSATRDGPHYHPEEGKVRNDPFMNPAHQTSTPSQPKISGSRRNYTAGTTIIRPGSRVSQFLPKFQAEASGSDFGGTGVQSPGSGGGVPASPSVRGGFLDRVQRMNAPGTPPYTPVGANLFQQQELPEAELE